MLFNLKFSLRTKLSVSYIFVALLLVAIISLSVNVFLQSQFKNYIMKQQQQANNEYVSLITKEYNVSDGSFNKSAVETIGVNALEQGVIIKVKDAAGKIVWDATVHNNGLCVQMIEHMSKNMLSHYPNFKGGFVQTSYPVKASFKVVGNVELGYYGPYYFTDNDINFLNNINTILIIVGLFSLVLALVLGTLMARHISLPISKTINAAEIISKGNFKERIVEKSTTKEINQLTGTINNLADTLEKQEILRKRMAADVAHELRTPLANLQSTMEALIDGIWEPDIERLRSCHEEIIRINRMVGDMEKLARIEAENAALNKSSFDLSKLIQHVADNFETSLKSKNISLDFLSEREVIEADKDKISQVFTNLLSNALKYTPEGGKVEIQVKGSDDFIEITVQDNGKGISAEDLPYIFERFYRADQSRNKLTGGLGLGLTISKAIVESHKGTINVSSELNKGTKFTVIIPKK
jgi:two-component system sensor histidine kinase BaeS